MLDITPPSGARDQAWSDLRDRLARAARELHFSATSPGISHGATLLAIAGNLAALAMSIPMAGSTPPQLVEASTLLAVQLLQDRTPKPRDGGGRKQITGPLHV
jgi:hypothetical protein